MLWGDVRKLRRDVGQLDGYIGGTRTDVRMLAKKLEALLEYLELNSLYSSPRYLIASKPKCRKKK